MCGFQNASRNTQYLDDKFLASGITLVTLSYRSPLTLVNSMRTWNTSGLLDLVQERISILSRPTPEEVTYFVFAHLFVLYCIFDSVNSLLIACITPFIVQTHMSTAFDFDVVEPQNIPDSVQVKPNVFTIGAAFYYALARAKTE